MTDSPKPSITFSIVTVCRNNKQGLAKTYKSLASQSAHDYEWIVIDGASDDNTISFFKSETERIQKKYFISEDDSGIYDAMNKGIKASHGAYILFLNAGDELADNNILGVLLKYAAKNPDFIYGDAIEATQPPVIKPARNHKDIAWGMFTHHQAMLYRRQKIIENRFGYTTLYEIAGDYDFTVRFLKIAKSAIYVPKPICVFEQGGLSQRKAKLGRREQFIIREEQEVTNSLFNVAIYFAQKISWNLKRKSPWLYKILRGFFFKKRSS